MAYGKIKADTLVYDNSGSDTEVTISSLGNKASLPASAGTVGASEVVQVDANKDITGFRNVTLSGNLTVNGTTTTIDSTTLTVEDKNIELGKVDTPTDTTADGGGITLKGATDKTFNWVDATDAWTSSEHINLGDNKKLLLGTGSDLNIYHDSQDTYINNSTGVLYTRSDTWSANAMSTSDKYIDATNGGSTNLYHDNSKKLETTTAGVTVTGTVTDSKGNLRSIPQSAQSSSYTCVAADAGKHVYATMSSGSNVTLPANVFSAGDAVTIINNSANDLSLISGTGLTMYNTADATSGNRTLAARGMATVLYVGATGAYISGAGLS